MWLWVKIKPPGIGPQVLVLGSIYQGNPFWWYPVFDPLQIARLFSSICLRICFVFPAGFKGNLLTTGKVLFFRGGENAHRSFLAKFPGRCVFGISRWSTELEAQLLLRRGVGQQDLGPQAQTLRPAGGARLRFFRFGFWVGATQTDRPGALKVLSLFWI